jgi:hypothetical protein
MTASQRFGGIRAVRDTLEGAGAPCARIVVSWASAGGIAAGGILVGAAALDAPELAQPLVSFAPALFVLGATGGLAVGALLAWAGRPTGVPSRTARTAIRCGAALCVPALTAAWVVTAWISLTSAVLTLHGAATLAVTAVGWVIGLIVCMWAAWEGWLALRAGVARAHERLHRVRTTPAW